MSPFDFDTPVDRSAFPTMSVNRDSLGDIFGNPDALPLWVADMDFPAPEAVQAVLHQRADHGLYGYAYKPESFNAAFTDWYATRQNWQIDPATVEQVPSVLNAIAVLIDQHSDPGDGVIVQPPVFFEFGSVISANGRKRVKNRLKLVDGVYEMDYDDLEEKAANPKNKVMIVCNPHNPVGRVWTRDELARAAEICIANDVLLISDEIHGDIVYAPHTFTPLATISEEVAQQTVTVLSPAKTFNIAGMVDAMAIIGDAERRERYHDFAHRFQINKTNVFALAATETAYREGGPWLDALLTYLQGNVDFVTAFLAERVPGVSLIVPQGTYLVWIDLTGLGMGAKDLHRFIVQDAGLAISAGHWFGREGAGYARMNIATPRAKLRAGLEGLAAAVESRA
jgi:cystathionine beta-lyase